MIKYTIEQKVALIKKLELYRLENNLSARKLAKLLHTSNYVVKLWDTFGALPCARMCYQIEKLTYTFTPTLTGYVLTAEDLEVEIRKAKESLQTRGVKWRKKTESKVE